MIKRLLFIVILYGFAASQLFANAEEKLQYFETINTNVQSAPLFHTLVINVEQNTSEWKAGIRTYDIILGVSGYKTASWTEVEYAYYAHKNANQPVDITLLRNNKIIVLKNVEFDKKTGIQYKNSKRLFVNALDTWGIDLEDIIGKELPRLGPEYSPLKSSDNNSSKAYSQLGVLAQLFNINTNESGSSPPLVNGLPVSTFNLIPIRAQESIYKLIKRNNASEKEWVTELLRVHYLLVTEKYKEALAIINEYGLTEKAPDSFLKQFSAFYKSLAANPPCPDNGIKRDCLDGDSSMITMCYPFPIIDLKTSTNSFQDTSIQKAFDLSVSGYESYASELYKISTQLYDSEERDTPAKVYMGRVLQAIVAPNHHGGWPYKTTYLFDKHQKRSIVSMLTRRIRNPDSKDRLLAAFSLLCSSMAVSSNQLFKEAYEIIYNTGDREVACANTFIFHALNSNFRNRKQHILPIIKAFDNKRDIPAIYKYLETNNSEFRSRSKNGYFVRNHYQVLDLGTYCSLYRWKIAKDL